MKITSVKRIPKQLKDFNDKEWQEYDLEHYGKDAIWKSGKRALIARSGKKIIGSVDFQYDGGVIYLKNITVIKDKQNKGIGKILMKKLEKIAIELKCHKIFLYTGKGWKANSFYKSIGFIKTSDLPNHYMHKDFVEYTKFI